MHSSFRTRPALLALLSGGALLMPAAVLAQPVVQPLPGTASAAPQPALDPAVQERQLAQQTLSGAIARIAADPNDSTALLQAGRSALTLGDPRAALGFLARAESLAPRDPVIKAALGAAMVRMEDAAQAMRFFDAAVSLGGLDRAYLADRGLAFDLLGNQTRAQADYAGAQTYAPSAEVTRRFAISLGIAGNSDAGIQLLGPLLRQQDRAAWRSRAMILAMNGRADEARQIAAATMPAQLASGLAPYFALMNRLTPTQLAAAAHFGRFPTIEVASAQPVRNQSPVVVAAADTTRTNSRDRRNRRTRTSEAPVTSVFTRPRPDRNASSVPVPARAAGAAAPTARQAAATAPAARTIPAQSATTPATASSPTAMVANIPATTVAPTASTPAATPVTTLPPQAAPVATPAARPLTPTAIPPSTVGAEPASPGAAPDAPVVQPILRPALTPSIRQPGADAPVAGPPDGPTPPTLVAPSPQPFPPAAATTSAPPSSSSSSAAAAAVPPPPAPVTVAAAAPTVSATTATDPAMAAPSTPQPSAPTAGTTVLSGWSLDSVVQSITVPESERQATDGALSIEELDAIATRRRREVAAAAAERRQREQAEARQRAETQAAERARAVEQAAEREAAEVRRRHPARIWVQVATGADANALAGDYRRLTQRHAQIFQGQSGSTAVWNRTRRLLVGPFPNQAAARAWLNRFDAAGGDGFVWSSAAGEEVTPVGRR